MAELRQSQLHLFCFCGPKLTYGKLSGVDNWFPLYSRKQTSLAAHKHAAVFFRSIQPQGAYGYFIAKGWPSWQEAIFCTHFHDMSVRLEAARDCEMTSLSLALAKASLTEGSEVLEATRSATVYFSNNQIGELFWELKNIFLRLCLGRMRHSPYSKVLSGISLRKQEHSSPRPMSSQAMLLLRSLICFPVPRQRPLLLQLPICIV